MSEPHAAVHQTSTPEQPSATEEAAQPEPPHTFNFADIAEFAARAVPDRLAVVCAGRRLTQAELDARANRLAHHFLEAGVRPGDFLGIYLSNATEYLEAMLAAWKVRAVPININHRYVADELRYLLDDSEAVALVMGRAQAPALAELAGSGGTGSASMARLRTVLVVDEPESTGPVLADALAMVPSAVAYDAAIDGQPPTPVDVAGRSGDDLYVLYTGGTTGPPKGVVWRMEDAFFPCFGGGDPARQSPVSKPEEIANHVLDSPLIYLCLAPLMHAAGQWVAFGWLWAGGEVVLHAGSLDPERAWQSVEDEGVNLFTIVGDAVGKPMLDCWLANPGRWDIASLFSISNGGAPLSPGLRQRLQTAFPNAILNDGFGSSETGAQGTYRMSPGGDGVARYDPSDRTAVLGDDLEPVAAGSGDIGRVALRGRIPLRYHNDPDKTAKTFIEHGGDRWVLTGDMAVVEADGTIRLLGRGSECINTGGEKVFPEEVEAVVQNHEAVSDVIVVGVPDERWGEAVCAVVQLRAGATLDLDELRAFCRSSLAGFKLPKQLITVDHVERSPAGKADYRWAHSIAKKSLVR